MVSFPRPLVSEKRFTGPKVLRYLKIVGGERSAVGALSESLREMEWWNVLCGVHSL